MLREEDEWMAELMSRSEIVAHPTVSASSSVGTPSATADAAADLVEPQNLSSKLNRVYKWGTCPKCAGKRSLQPHVFSANAKSPGRLVLYCSGWWKAGDQNGRACWFQKDFPMERKNELSRFLKDKYNDLSLSLRRNAAQT